ncbi:hypothetical protein [Polaromonas sp.]|jgi:hypothetical protein|uniref:hypothetical protein n=1 Tax=Polaromonas sp. TaxID=1869339 RepID=UPI001D2F6F31|nr:hypothetical protein [Polaromonas sp.]MBT9477489.1 hypothetical protein [Polaromonas sp.]
MPMVFYSRIFLHRRRQAMQTNLESASPCILAAPANGGKREPAPSTAVIASEVWQSMTALFRQWIATACGLGATETAVSSPALDVLGEDDSTRLRQWRPGKEQHEASCD